MPLPSLLLIIQPNMAIDLCEVSVTISRYKVRLNWFASEYFRNNLATVLTKHERFLQNGTKRNGNVMILNEYYRSIPFLLVPSLKI